MTRFNLNWKYIIGEILLIFFGITLAISFNNWNSSTNKKKNKRIAIEKVSEELKSDLKELKNARHVNQNDVNAYLSIKPFFKETTSTVVISASQLLSMRSAYPGFYTVKDSILLNDTVYQYTGKTFIGLEIPELSQIAGKTTATYNITQEIPYECMYDLESIYNLQERSQKEMNKAVDALQKGEIDNLITILTLLEQLNEQFQIDYEQMLTEIELCS